MLISLTFPSQRHSQLCNGFWWGGLHGKQFPPHSHRRAVLYRLYQWCYIRLMHAIKNNKNNPISPRDATQFCVCRTDHTLPAVVRPDLWLLGNFTRFMLHFKKKQQQKKKAEEKQQNDILERRIGGSFNPAAHWRLFPKAFQQLPLGCQKQICAVASRWKIVSFRSFLCLKLLC